jgi:hypothetical protein
MKTIKPVKHYKHHIYKATQELRDITNQMDKEFFEECMQKLGLRYCRYISGGGDWTALELVDHLCNKKGAGVRSFSSVCLVPTSDTHYAVETTNCKFFGLLTRLFKLGAFL